ncbi:MAG: ComEC/Rec2 family competence protein, partial [Patescibacteria group bacterium]
MLFIIGVAAADFFTCPPLAVFCLLLSLCAGVISLGLFFNQRRRLLRCCLIFTCCLLFGFWRYGVSLPDYGDQSKIYHYVSSTQEFIGAVRAVDNRLGSQKLTVAVAELKQAGLVKRVSGSVLITAPLYPDYRYGDTLKVKCFLKLPGLIEDFDYGRYLAKSGIFVYCGFADINTAISASRSPVGLFFDFKDHLFRSLNAAISEPEVSLLRGILLGDGRGLPEKYAQLFSDLGLTHIIAISGDHIAIIAVALLELLLALGWSRPKAFWPMALIIAFYVALVGAPASAVRSAIMALAVMYAKKIGRASRIANVLVLTAALMILVNPAILLADIGFQLSFLAICGLSYVSP